MYHRFGDSRYPSTNIRIEQFEAHLKELKNGKYTVMPLSEIVTALAKGHALPDRAVAITIDDAFLSVYKKGWPRLRDAGFPFTLFVSTDAADAPGKGYMSWDQIRKLKAAGVAIGHHGAAHVSYLKSGIKKAAADLKRASTRFKAELGHVPKFFAFPYGETNPATTKMIRTAGFQAAFGQHSGAFEARDNPHYLARFPLNERYGEFSRFKLVVNSLPLSTVDMTPKDTVVAGLNPPSIGFTVTEKMGDLKNLNCYASHEGKVKIIQQKDRRIDVQLKTAFPKGRSRINCTLPTDQGRWRWLGRQFYVPK